MPITTKGRVIVFLAGLAVVWVTAVLVAAVPALDLTIGMLVVLVEVVGIAVVCGIAMGVVAAIVSVLVIGWYMATPYGSFEVISADTVTGLVVYTLLAVSASVMVGLLSAARAQVLVRDRRASLVAELLDEGGGVSHLRPVAMVAASFDLDLVRLEHRAGNGDWAGVERAERDSHPDSRRLVLPFQDDYRLVVSGPTADTLDRDLLQSAATAVLRAHQAHKLVEEREHAQALAHVDQGRSALLASLGHDVRTPLASLALAVDGLRHDSEVLTSGQRQELLATAAESTQRLDGLLTNLLDSARLQAGVVISQMEPILIVEVAARATVAVGDPASMDLDVDESLPPVMADPGLLERVLVNLLENALRHSGSADVALRARATGTAVVVDVVDHGAGPSGGDGTGSKREHRLGRSSTDSSGLGLTIVEGFTRAMGVQVSRRETAGGGLTVSLELQRAPG